MTVFSPHHGRYFPPRLVLAVFVVELVAVAALAVLDVPWSPLLGYGGSFVLGFTLALLAPTVQELGRRQPKLSLSTKGSGDEVFVSTARPWPVDVQRVLANEVAEARETARRRHSALDSFVGLSGPFAVRPSEADHQRAQEKFAEEVVEFEGELRNWLTEYADAARAYADTFEVTITLDNAASGAHAEDVTVVLDLPETVSIAEDLPDLLQPPDRPVYQPPRARPISPIGPVSQFPVIRPDLTRAIVEPAQISLRDPTWAISDDGRHLEASAGDIHPDRRADIGEPLLFRACGSGRHVIRWTAYTKSARKAAGGTITLELPPDPQRPAFGRLHGITSYPDVRFIDEEGEVVGQVRNSDPPPRPKPSSDAKAGVLDRLQAANAFWEWQALGLDPADDGPERPEVQKAKPVSKSA